LRAGAESDVDILVVLNEVPDYWAEINRAKELISQLSLDYRASVSRVLFQRANGTIRSPRLLRMFGTTRSPHELILSRRRPMPLRPSRRPSNPLYGVRAFRPTWFCEESVLIHRKKCQLRSERKLGRNAEALPTEARAKYAALVRKPVEQEPPAPRDEQGFRFVAIAQKYNGVSPPRYR